MTQEQKEKPYWDTYDQYFTYWLHTELMILILGAKIETIIV